MFGMDEGDANRIKQIIDACKNSECNIIVGIGVCRQKLWGILQQSDVSITCFCDNNAEENQTIFGHSVFLPQEAVSAYPNALYIIAVMNSRNEVLEQLIKLGVSENNILHFYTRTYEYYRTISEEHYLEELEELYYVKMGHKLDLKNPRRFTEKIQWIKLHDKNPLRTTLADKYAVRNYIKNKIGEEHLIPLLGVWKSFGDYPKYKKELERPSELEELYRFSKILCEEFEYVRVDFYIVSGQVLFGEMTFTPASGIYYVYNDDWTVETDLMLGEKSSCFNYISMKIRKHVRIGNRYGYNTKSD